MENNKQKTEKYIPTGVPYGFGGWLTLFRIGLLFSILAFGKFIVVEIVPNFSNEDYKILTNPVSELYNPLYSTFIITELITNIFLLSFCILLLILCQLQKKLFPKLSILFLGLNIVFIVIEIAFLGYIDNAITDTFHENIFGIIKAIAIAGIWIPYLLLSKRVKNTFTE